MKKSAAPRPVRYQLRIGLVPGFSRAEERALWRIIRTARIDEVAFFAPHAEERSPGLGTLEECERWVGAHEPLFRRVRKAGLAASINPWWTVSFSSFPGFARDQHDEFPFRWAVGIDGKESRVVACPLDEKWRQHTRRMYRILARLKPARLWLDDDVRATLRADLHCPCFCDVCLREMETRTGKKRNREELLKRILADPPNPVREAWLQFQGDLIRDVVASLTGAVHEVSPATHVSLMFGPIESHYPEGRKWDELVAVLGQPTPYLRPHIGPYIEGMAVQTADGFNATRLAQAVLPAHAVSAPEIENYPHTRFAKSVKVARLQMVLSQLIGLNEITLSIFRFAGRLDLERETIWERMLGQSKPFFQAVADLQITRDQLSGISLFWHEDISRHVRGVAGGTKPMLLYRQRPLDSALPLLGFATRYGSGGVTVLTAEQPGCLGPADLEDIFSRGVLLDARAAESLLLMGRGELAGITGKQNAARAVMETIEDKAFGGHIGEPMSARYNGTPWQFRLAKGARIISKLRGYRGEETGHGVFVHENCLGGRVAVLPYDSQAEAVSHFGVAMLNPLTSATFLTWARQAQLWAVLEWLGRKPVPLFIPGAPAVYPLLVDQAERLVVAVANLHSDPITRLTLCLGSPRFRPRRVHLLQADGSWWPCQPVVRNQGADTIALQTGMALDHMEVAVLKLEQGG